MDKFSKIIGTDQFVAKTRPKDAWEKELSVKTPSLRDINEFNDQQSLSIQQTWSQSCEQVRREPVPSKFNFENFYVVETLDGCSKSDTEETKYEEKDIFKYGYSLTECPNWTSQSFPRKQDLRETIKKSVSELRNMDDVDVKIGNRIFKCNTLLLRIYSGYFDRLEYAETVELPSSKVAPQAFFMIYKWMQVDHPLIERQGFLELFVAANYLEVKQLVQQCWDCLNENKNLHEDMAFEMYLDARENNQPQIEDFMIARISKYFLFLVAHKEFVELPLERIVKIFTGNRVAVQSEVEILMAACRWLMYDMENREKHIVKVMKCVRFAHLQPTKLVALKQYEKDDANFQKIIQHPKVNQMIIDALSFLSVKSSFVGSKESLVIHLQHLKMAEPMIRQWVRYKNRPGATSCFDQMDISFNAFLEHLMNIRKMGEKYWKNLEFVINTSNT